MKKINIIVLFLLYLVSVKVNLKASDNEKKRDMEESTEESIENISQNFNINHVSQEVLEMILSFSGLDINSITDSDIKQLLEISKVNKHLKATINRALEKIQKKTNTYLDASKSPVEDAAKLGTYFAKRWLQKRAYEGKNNKNNEFSKKVGRKIREYLLLSADLRAEKKLSKKQKRKQNEAISKATFLMRSGVGLDIPGKKNDCPLMIAINQNNIYMVKKLLKSKANPNVKDDIWDSALIRAVEQNNIEIAELLLRYGANPNTVDMSGDTALMIAAINRNIKMVKLLINSCPNIKIRNNLGLTALESVIKRVKTILKNSKNLGFEEAIRKDNHLQAYKEIIKILKNYKLNGKSSQCVIS